MKAVRIVSQGTGSSTQVIDEETGAALSGITSIDVSIRPRELVDAALTLTLVKAQIEARPVFMMIDPLTGQDRQVVRIVFKDGEERDLA